MSIVTGFTSFDFIKSWLVVVKWRNDIMHWHSPEYLLCLTTYLLQPHSFLTHHPSFYPFFILQPFRLAFDGQEASHYHPNPREVSSTNSSPYKTLPRPPRDPRSMPPTPVMTRNAYSSSQLRYALCSPALPTHYWFFSSASANSFEWQFKSCVLSPGWRGLLIASGIAVEVWNLSPGWEKTQT